MAKSAEKTEETNDLGMIAKDVIAAHGEKGTVIKFADRVELVVIKETKHYKVGMEIAPHRVFAEELIKNGIAKEVDKK